ncbi:MAG: hypothetical protein ACRENG_09920, partial [bacterium]
PALAHQVWYWREMPISLLLANSYNTGIKRICRKQIFRALDIPSVSDGKTPSGRFGIRDFGRVHEAQRPDGQPVTEACSHQESALDIANFFL